MKFIRSDNSNKDFQNLVELLDEVLRIADGELHDFYHQYNGLENLKKVVLCYEGEQAVACGAFKDLEDGRAEVKRMYTLPEYRGKGIATRLLSHLEEWITELNYQSIVLETGKQQPDAIALYDKNGYERIPNYGQYQDQDNSVCFRKKLVKKA